MSYPTCPDNQKHQHYLIYDYRTGDVIDPTTGEVVDRIYVYQPFTRTGDDEYIMNINIVTPNDEMHPLHIPQTAFECLNDIMELYDEIKTKLPIYAISKYYLNLTLRMYLKHLKRHVHDHVFKAALLYIALEQHDVIVDDVDYALTVGISRNELKSAILEVKRKLGKKVRYIPFTTRVVELIKYFGRKFNLETKHILEAIKLVKSKPLPNKYTPRSIALAIVYLIMEKNNYEFDSVNAKTRVPKKVAWFIAKTRSSPNLYKIIRELRNYYNRGKPKCPST